MSIIAFQFTGRSLQTRSGCLDQTLMISAKIKMRQQAFPMHRTSV